MKLNKRVFSRQASLQPVPGASALVSADRFAGGRHAARNPCYTLAIAPLSLWFAWGGRPSSLAQKSIASLAPPITKHHTARENAILCACPSGGKCCSF